MGIRLRLLILAFLAAYSALFFNLYQHQIVKGERYLARAESQYLASGFINSKRGAIYFTSKDNTAWPAAINQDFPIIYAVPKWIEDAAEAANTLSAIIGKPVAELEKAFSNTQDQYEMLIRKASPGLAQKITDLDLKGIYVEMKPARFYPSGPAASQVLGYVGPDESNLAEIGHYGIEKFYNRVLSPETVTSTNRETEEDAGEDITLTIDLNIQMEAEKTLEGLMKTYTSTAGTIIVADPGTGKILAMANAPNFDGNEYQKYPLSRFINPAVQHIYEPGSVFKVLTMAAGIDAGKITSSTIYNDPGRLTLNGKTIQNFDFEANGPHGRTTMTQVIERSLNTGSVFVQRQMGRDIFTSYLKKFGIDEKMGIDLPGETKGSLKQLTPQNRDIAFATASYGQGVSVTPIELLSAISAIANGGKLMRPYLNSALEPQVIRTAIKPSTAREVTAMMVSSVNKNQVAKINGFKIAGKTGTAYVPDFQNGGYTSDVINTYVGFGPASSPKFIVLIKLDQPQGAPLAGLSVVPAFRDLAQFIINYYGLEPDALKK